MPPAPLATSADEAIRALARHAGAERIAAVRGDQLLTERACLLGLTFAPRRSAGGSCRLLDTCDGVIAVSLPRPTDWELVPAWLEDDTTRTWSWSTLSVAVRERHAGELLERARLLGMAAAIAGRPVPTVPPFHRVLSGPPLPPQAAFRSRRPPRVVDLSALWAGPLCGHLLDLCGADVIKVEAVDRPDGARDGNASFYGLLNQHKRAVALDFHEPGGRQALVALIRRADVVIEASRPRALRQLGIDAEALVAQQPGLTWVSITGYGRGDEADRIAFGDDAGVAAGLAHVMRTATGDYQLAGDAIADPLTGIHAALAAWRSWQSGGGRLISLSLADVAAAGLADEIGRTGHAEVRRSFGTWWAAVCGQRLEPDLPMRPVTGHVASMGEHTRTVLSEPGCSC